jgi:hypothetical protein
VCYPEIWTFIKLNIHMQLEIPSGENILLAAYREVLEGKQIAPSELVSEYQRYFTVVGNPVPERRPVFERFSIVDTNVKLTIASDTTPA